MRKLFPSCLLTVFWWAGFIHSQNSTPTETSEHPAISVREQREVVIHGLREQWRLEWKGPAKPYCGANELSMAITCPCEGFAYGESGDLYLVRARDGREIERLHLTPLFEENGTAVVQRWSKDDRADFRSSDKEDISEMVSKRPIVQVMHLEDYDHDGNKSEFYLQTESAPCGKSVGVVVGLSTNNPRLHVFGTVANPSKPLYMQRREWQALRDASSNAVDVLDWACGDHGADTQTELQLQWSTKGIDGKRREYTCPPKHEGRKLIRESQI